MRDRVLGLVGSLEVRDVLERGAVAIGLALALGQDVVQGLELAQPEGRLHVGHAAVPAALGVALEDDVLRAVAREVRQVHRVLAQRAQALGHRRVVDGDHAALAGGDDLARVQREAGQRAERADRPALVLRADGARGVLDELEPVALGQRDEGVHVRRQPDLVHGHDRLRALGDRALGRRGVEVVGQRVDVGEDRRRAALPDGVGRGDEGQRRDDDLVAGADARDVEREVQRGGAVGRGHRVGRAHALGVGGLEGGDARALGDPAGGDGLGDGGAVGLGQRRAANGTSIRRPSPAGSPASSRSTRHQ